MHDLEDLLEDEALAFGANDEPTCESDVLCLSFDSALDEPLPADVAEQSKPAAAELCWRPIALTELGGKGESLILPCGTRRADKCGPCAERYAELLRRSTMDGLPNPDANDPGLVAFFTLTQPSFGAVYSYAWTKADTYSFLQRNGLPYCPSEDELAEKYPTAAQRLYVERNYRLRKLRPEDRLIEGHSTDDAKVGAPKYPDTYDYAGQVLYNRMASTMLDRSKKHILRQLKPYSDLGCDISIRAFAEFQRRGALHFHLLVVVRRPADWDINKGFYPDLTPSARRRVPASAVPQPQPANATEVYTDSAYLRKDKRGNWWSHPYLNPDLLSFSNLGLADHLRATWGGGPETAVPAQVKLSITDWADEVRAEMRSKWTLPFPMTLPDTANYQVPDFVKWGPQFDVRGLATHDDVPDRTKTAASVAGYLSKYVTKASGASFGNLKEMKRGPFKKHILLLRAEVQAQMFTFNFVKMSEAHIRKLQSERDEINAYLAELDELEPECGCAFPCGISRSCRNSHLAHLRFEIETVIHREWETMDDDLHALFIEVFSDNLCNIDSLEAAIEECSVSTIVRPRGYYSSLRSGQQAMLPITQTAYDELRELKSEYIDLYELNELLVWQRSLNARLTLIESELIAWASIMDEINTGAFDPTPTAICNHGQALSSLSGYIPIPEWEQSSDARIIRGLNKELFRLRRWLDFAGHHGIVVYSSNWRSSISKVKQARREWFFEQHPELAQSAEDTPRKWRFNALGTWSLLEQRKVLRM